MAQLLTPTEFCTVCSNPLFAGMDAEAVAALISGGSRVIDYAKHQALETADTLGILLFGRGCIRRVGQEGMVLDYIAPPRVFGLATIYLENAQLSEIRALTPMRVLCFSRAQVDAMMDASPSFRLNFLRYLSSRVAFLGNKLDAASTMSAEARLFAYVQEHAGADGTLLVRNFSQFAELLGVSRASLYRTLESLSAQGLLQREGKLLRLEHPAQ